MNKIFIKRKCKKCNLVISLTGKQPTHCGIVALLLKDVKICKAPKKRIVMMDKVQKICEVIEKRYEYWREKEFNSHSIESEIRMYECQYLLLMLNSLQEEPISEDLEDYINELSKQFPEVSFAKLSRIAVRVAKWQKEQDQSTIELAEDHAMLAGMEKMKEQMMKEAIDGYVIEDIEEGNGDFLLSCEYLPKNMGLVDKQKVKVIVIKKD